MSVRIEISKVNKQILKKLIVTETESKIVKKNVLDTIEAYRCFVPEGESVPTEIMIPMNFAINNGFERREKSEYTETNFEMKTELEENQKVCCRTARDHLMMSGSTHFETGTGSGKSVMIARMIQLVKVKALVTTTRKTIKKGWVETFNDLTTARCLDLESTNTLFKSVKEFPDFDVIVCLPSCIDKLFTMYPEVARDIGILVVDEAHMYCTQKNINTLLSISPRFLILSTATLDKSNGFDKAIQLLSGPNKVTEDVNVGYAAAGYTLHALKTEFLGEEKMGPKGIIAASVWESLSQNVERLQLHVDIIKRALEKDPMKKFIILTRVVVNIDRLCDMIREQGITCDTFYGSKDTYSNTTVLIGTVSKIGTGFDEARACPDFHTDPRSSNTLILSHTIGEPNLFKQCVGRVLRALRKTKYCDPKPVNVIWLMDRNKSCSKHLTSVTKMIKKENGRIVKCDSLDNLELV